MKNFPSLTMDAWEEEKHPRRPDGKFGKGGGENKSTNSNENAKIEVSSTGSNIFKVKNFRSKQALNNHVSKHGKEYPGFTKEQYIKRALELIEQPVSGEILGHKTKDNVLIRYDKNTNDFVKGRPDKGIYTMFKPIEGQAYYDKQKEEDLKHGGK